MVAKLPRMIGGAACCPRHSRAGSSSRSKGSTSIARVGLVADQVPSLLRRFFFSLSPASTPSEVIGLSHSSIHPSSRELKKGQTTLQ
jgi:hypothetical protein